jgi:catechol 2,3-dioxygenase-like lactoylglutathione lyase family enzyme
MWSEPDVSAVYVRHSGQSDHVMEAAVTIDGEAQRAPASRREDLLGVHSLDHFSLTVPDLTEAENFYRRFGLGVRERDNALALHTDGSDHRWGRISDGPRKHLEYLSFGAFPDDVARFGKHLAELGIPRLEPPPGVDRDGIWFRDHDGSLLEITPARKSSPDAKSTTSNPTSPPGARWAPLRSEAPEVRPRRLQHVLVFTRDIDRAIDFYVNALGLRLSDRAGDVAFLHGVHGSDHHMVAFAKSTAPGFHHCSWDMGSVHEVGVGAMRMADYGFDRGWGLGQHVLGSNYFHYVRDPWGSYSEYSAGMDYIPCALDWQAGDHSPDNGFYLWGPTVPEDFARNFEAD